MMRTMPTLTKDDADVDLEADVDDVEVDGGVGVEIDGDDNKNSMERWSNCHMFDIDTDINEQQNLIYKHNTKFPL